MPDEPNKQIDQALRAYARERRKAADLPLHPATRKILQGEVARAYKRSDSGVFRRFQKFWPQFAFGSGLAAILVIAVLSLRQRNDRHAVQSESKVELQKVVDQPSTPIITSADSDRREADLRLAPAAPAQKEAVPAPDNLAVAPSPVADASAPPVRAPEPKASEVRFEELERRNELFQVKDASEIPARTASTRVRAAQPPTAAAQLRLLKANDLTNLGAAMRLRFVELPERGRQDEQPLLTSFQVEQTGNGLILFDQDGSVYSGELSPQAPAQPEILGFGLTPAVFADANVATYYFTAQGTNKTLAKRVTVQGRYLERTNASIPNKAVSITPAAATRQGTLPTALSQARRAIIGKATIAQTNEIPVRAISVEP